MACTNRGKGLAIPRGNSGLPAILKNNPIYRLVHTGFVPSGSCAVGLLVLWLPSSAARFYAPGLGRAASSADATRRRSCCL